MSGWRRRLRYAAALVRNVIAPLPGRAGAAAVARGGGRRGGSGQEHHRQHAVRRGLGRIESAGRLHAPSGRLRRRSTGAIAWPSSLGFLGTLQRLARPEPSSLDADVYQVRRVSQEAGQFGVLEKFLVWDCPDMTTWAATGYVPRLLEVPPSPMCGLRRLR